MCSAKGWNLFRFDGSAGQLHRQLMVDRFNDANDTDNCTRTAVHSVALQKLQLHRVIASFGESWRCRAESGRSQSLDSLRPGLVASLIGWRNERDLCSSECAGIRPRTSRQWLASGGKDRRSPSQFTACSCTSIAAAALVLVLSLLLSSLILAQNRHDGG